MLFICLISISLMKALLNETVFEHPKELLTKSPEYRRVQHDLSNGWNTWNNHSVLSHVLLPEGFALSLGFQKVSANTEMYLQDVLPGRSSLGEQVYLGPHAYDGSYTALIVEWQGLRLMVERATRDDDLMLLVTPLVIPREPPRLVVESGLLWDRTGRITLKDGSIIARLPHRRIQVQASKQSVVKFNIASNSPHLVLRLDAAIGISTGRKRTFEEIRAIVFQKKAENAAEVEAHSDVLAPIQAVMAWDTIYEP